MADDPIPDPGGGPHRGGRGRPAGFTDVLRKSIVERDNEAVTAALRWYMPFMSRLVIKQLRAATEGALTPEQQIEAAGQIVLNIQEVAFMKADESTITHFTNFLANVAQKEVYKKIRSEERHDPDYIVERLGLRPEGLDRTEDPAGVVSGEDLLGALGRLVKVHLPRQLRRAAIARFIDGKPVPEIARQLGVHKSTVQADLHKAAGIILGHWLPNLRELAPDLAAAALKDYQAKLDVREARQERILRRRRARTVGQPPTAEASPVTESGEVAP